MKVKNNCKGCGVGSSSVFGYCSVACFNTFTKTKGIDGYRKCINCGKEFPFRNSLIKRNCYSKKYGCLIARKDQKVCCFKCLVQYRNKFENPAKTKSFKKKISEIAKRNYLTGKLKINTKASHKKQAETISGTSHWNWQGGKTPLSKKARNSKETKEWRDIVFKRDNYTCQICGIRGGYLEADHIKPWCAYPELRHSIDNGRTLCKACHKETDTYMGRAVKYSRATGSCTNGLTINL